MADRYWVGGTGTWNSTNTTNWSATSGGTGGASVPTSADNVIFNTNSGTGTVTFSGSIDCLTFTFTSSTITVSAGTSTLTVASSGVINFPSVALTFYNVNFTGGGITNINIYSTPTFNNLSVTATAAGTKPIVFAGTTTINGSLTTSGTSSTNRVEFRSSVAGTQRTLSVATIGTLTNTNWKDIALTGAASPWTAPLGVFDLGNNSGITFDTTTLYWVGGAGSWSDSAKWSTSSGGAGGAGVPGPTNSVRIDASSGTGTQTGGSTTTPSYCKDYDSSGSSITTANTILLYCYGSFKCRSGVTNTFNGIQFFGAGTHTVDPNGSTNMSAGGGFSFGGTGTYTLMNNWVSSNTFVHSLGTLNTNGYSVSGNVFQCNGNQTRTLNLGASTLTFSSASSFDFSGTNLTLNAGTSTLNCSGGFNGGTGNTFYDLNLTMISASNQQIDGSSTFNNFTVTGPSSVGVKRITLSGNQTINGTLTAIGSNGNQRIAFLSLDYITPITLSANSVSIVDVDFNKIIATGSASWSGTRIGNIGQNTGITFTAPKTVYWNLATGGDLYTATGWASSSGGTPATTNMPLGQDTAIIEDTGLNSGATVSYGTLFSTVPNLTFSSRTLPVTFNIGTTVYVAGDITLSSAVTLSGTSNTIFSGTTNLTVAGKTWPYNPSISGTLTIADPATFSRASTSQTYVGGTLTLNAPLTFSAIGFTNSGTINLNSYTLTALTFAASNTGTLPTLNFGTGKIVVTGSGTIVFSGVTNQVVTGTPVVEATYSGGTGTRTISNGGTSETSSVSIKVTAGTDTVSLLQGLRDVDFTGFSGTLSNNDQTIYGNLTLSTGMTLAAGTSVITFAATSGTKTITTNGKTLDFPITFNGVGGTWQLADNLTQGSTRAMSLSGGTLDLNGKTLQCGSSFAITSSNTKNITFNGGTLLCTGTTSAFSNTGVTGFSTTAGTGTGKISLNNASAKTFGGGSAVYNCTLENSGAGAMTINGANTISNLSNSVQPTSFLFQASTTHTFTDFSVSGTSGNLVTIGSATAANHTLSKSTGEVNVSYCSISRSTATGGATWKAYTINGNVNGGNNSGWLFSDATANGLLFGSNF